MFTETLTFWCTGRKGLKLHALHKGTLKQRHSQSMVAYHLIALSSGVFRIHSSVVESRMHSVCKAATLLPCPSSVMQKQPAVRTNRLNSYASPCLLVVASRTTSTAVCRCGACTTALHACSTCYGLTVEASAGAVPRRASLSAFPGFLARLQSSHERSSCMRQCLCLTLNAHHLRNLSHELLSAWQRAVYDEANNYLLMQMLCHIWVSRCNQACCIHGRQPNIA